jgi:exopolysaccharide biosynthesis polyprenyl glycosylphosphotransferase
MREYPTDSFDYTVLKRILDLVMSASLLIILAPLLLLIALGVKLSSTGPVIFRQRRVGLNGRMFWIYKFRTMKTRSRDVSDTQWTATDETQVTPTGRYLRRTSLDELPQLINVLKGDMSMVGPRPERPYFVEIFNRDVPQYMKRHIVKCGITGWAQVHGWRGNTSIHKRIEFDLDYVERWTLWSDLRILLLTLWRGILQLPVASGTSCPETARRRTSVSR